VLQLSKDIATVTSAFSGCGLSLYKMLCRELPCYRPAMAATAAVPAADAALPMAGAAPLNPADRGRTEM